MWSVLSCNLLIIGAAGLVVLHAAHPAIKTQGYRVQNNFSRQTHKPPVDGRHVEIRSLKRKVRVPGLLC